MINYKAGNFCLRYIVPFTYNDIFDDMCSKVDVLNIENKKSGGKPVYDWVRCTPESFTGESDLYAYIREEFMFKAPEGRQPADKMGAQWLHRVKKSNPLMKLLYLRDYDYKNTNISEKWEDMYSSAIRIDLTAMGLYVFRNGLGFIWFELCTPNVKDKNNPKHPGKPEEIDADVLMEMQVYVKELNSSKCVRLLRINSKEFEEGCVFYKAPDNSKMYLAPFFPGIMIADTMSDLGVTFLTERKSHYYGMVKIANEFINAFPSENKKTYSDKTAEKKNERTMMPDKTVLFSYATFINPEDPIDLGEEEDRYALTYYLTNGYTYSYEFSPDKISEMKRPFKNAYWFASKEGVSYFKWPNKENESTFSGVIRFKVKNDYFALFIKILFQSYSLLLLGRKIQEDISTARIEDMSDKDYAKIESRYEETNLFLTKSMATSVSHIGHQSDFYAYLKGQYRIAEDVQSITVGLEALDSMQKEKRDEDKKKRDEAVQNALGFISILAIASALIDGYDFIATKARGLDGGWDWLRQDHYRTYIAEIVYTSLVLAFGVFIIIVCFRGLIKKKNGEPKKSIFQRIREFIANKFSRNKK